MGARRLPNGNILLQWGATDRGVRADGYREIGPDHPDFAASIAWLKRVNGHARPIKPSITALLITRMNELEDAGKHDEAEALKFLAVEPNGLEEYFAKELAAYDLPPELDEPTPEEVGTAENAEPPQKISEPPLKKSKPTAKQRNPKPNKSKKPKGK